MSLSSSLYAGISGLSTMGNGMSVLGDNVANVNTIAFKSSRSTFQDVLSQSVATAAGSAQVGRGVTLTTVDGLFAQGSFESTSTPTDMAIGGEGFFMLRAADSAEADMYTRAGEFRFNTQGYLTSPAGHFVQGWNVDSITGQIQGTIGDINLGRATPPVATEKIDLIVNVDSRTPRETTEQRLFDAWNGTNMAAVNPTSPIDAANFEYTTAIKVYDSKGAAHDVTIYFDRTTQDNQYEFLVTCDPESDLRTLDEREQVIYAPNERYNYEQHKGAGALMYGVIDFNTSGSITAISAWEVPPDGKVDPAQNTNRITLGATENYYSFGANFTGADFDQMIELNFGARYTGQPTNIAQILVTNRGAYSDQNSTIPINRETLWQDVYDVNGNRMTTGDLITVTGYDNAGKGVSYSYTVQGNQRVGVFLENMGSAFGATATIDAEGRIKITDNSPGYSGLAVTSLNVYSANEADPFGGGDTALGNVVTATSQFYSNSAATIPATSSTTLLAGLFDDGGRELEVGDVLSFTGTDTAGASIDAAPQPSFTVGAGSTIGNLMTYLESIYGNVSASLDNTGAIRLYDLTGTSPSLLAPTVIDTTTIAQPLGAVPVNWGNGDATPVIYQDEAMSTAVVAGDNLAGSFDAAGKVIANGDILTFSGTDTASGPVGPVNFIIGTTGTTVQELMGWLDTQFDATAQVTVSLVGGAISFVDASGILNIELDSTTNAVKARPLGIGAFDASSANVGGMINVTTTMRELISPDRAFSTASTEPPVITADTNWDSVFDSAGDQVLDGDTISFAGTDRNSTSVSGSYTINLTAEPMPTVQDFLDEISEAFNVDAFIDRAGRLILRDRIFDPGGDDASNLNFRITEYAGGGAEIFGPASTTTYFTAIPGSLEENGSRMGTVASRSFETEAMSSTQYANSSTTIFQDQDGFAAGFLQSVSVDTQGIITGNYSNGQVLMRAQVALANFANLQGLHKVGGNIFRTTTASGAPVTGQPGTNGLGSISPNSLEQSNVDLGTEFVKLITTQRGFQANSKIITTTDEMLNDLINIKR